MLKRSPRSEKLDLRLTPEAKRKIAAAAAAEARHCSVSDFVLQAALTRADEVYADQSRIFLDAAQWAKFQEVLDAPPRDHPRMRRLLNEPSIFEKSQQS